MKKLTIKEKAIITKLQLNKDDWWMIILSTRDGYFLETSDKDLIPIRSADDNEIEADELLLWEVLNYFGMRPSRYERECLAIIREMGDKYIPQKDEKIVKKCYEVVKKK